MGWRLGRKLFGRRGPIQSQNVTSSLGISGTNLQAHDPLGQGHIDIEIHDPRR